MLIDRLKNVSKKIRYNILRSTTQAGSGHPTSSLSAVELMTALFFGGIFKLDKEDFSYEGNDRLIFSKGHASPLFYSLWEAAGMLDVKELDDLRKFDSVLEGHPTKRFRFTEAATGSLGQGLSIGVGMAIDSKYIKKIDYKTYVLLGDSEMTEGSQWESIQIASHYELDSLIGIIDVNRLGQRGPTMYGHDVFEYQRRIAAFGWETFVIDGHDFKEILSAYDAALKITGRPTMIIAKTVKGKGVSFLEDKDGYHGKALSEEDLDIALRELGSIEKGMEMTIDRPKKKRKAKYLIDPAGIEMGEGKISTRKAYGIAITGLYSKFNEMVVLDAEVSNSTYSEVFKKKYPERFFEMFVAEQNMVGAALGMALRGNLVFASTFAAFYTRAFDQIRMSQYSDTNIKFVGSHAGVSIGQDGGSQMGLEDIAMFRTVKDCVVFYPSDGNSTIKIVEKAAEHKGNVYIRTTRMDTPKIYDQREEFPIGGLKILKESTNDSVTIIAAGITLHESLRAYEELRKKGIDTCIIDLYCIKPLDKKSLIQQAEKTKKIITVEDHYPEGGIGEAVSTELSQYCFKVYPLSVSRLPRSGKPEELLDFEGISSKAIVKKVLDILEENKV